MFFCPICPLLAETCFFLLREEFGRKGIFNEINRKNNE
jgi:hypothetical protein